MPKMAVKRNTDYRLIAMIRGEMAAQGVSTEKAAEYAGIARSTLYDLLKSPTKYFRQTLRLMRGLQIPIEAVRETIAYPY